MHALHLLLFAGIIAALGLAFANPDNTSHCQAQHTLTTDACYLELTK